MASCKLCDFVAVSEKTLAGHIARGHKVKIQEYYDMYFGKTLCGCGQSAQFVSLIDGYRTSCMVCIKQQNNERRSAFTKEMKARLKADPVKWQQFRERTSKAVTQMWQTIGADQKQQRVTNMMANHGKNSILQTAIHSDDVGVIMPYDAKPFNEIFGI